MRWISTAKPFGGFNIGGACFLFRLLSSIASDDPLEIAADVSRFSQTAFWYRVVGVPRIFLRSALAR